MTPFAHTKPWAPGVAHFQLPFLVAFAVLLSKDLE